MGGEPDRSPPAPEQNDTNKVAALLLLSSRLLLPAFKISPRHFCSAAKDDYFGRHKAGRTQQIRSGVQRRFLFIFFRVHLPLSGVRRRRVLSRAQCVTRDPNQDLLGPSVA